MLDLLVARHILPNGPVLELVQGDITTQPVDAIVNAANSRLKHGAGVAGAVLSRGGREIQQESDRWVREHGRVSHAEPAVTGAGRLPCRYVIHAVGPVWGEGDEDARLGAAVSGSLRRAEALNLESIALPAISTGVFGFPKERAARVILAAIQSFYAGLGECHLRTIRLVLYDHETAAAFHSVWAEFWPEQE